MAIFSIPPVSDFSGVTRLSSLQSPGRAAHVAQIPLVATPSVVVTLGTNNTPLSLYDSAGLLPAVGSAAAAAQHAAAADVTTPAGVVRRTSTDATIRTLGSLLTSDLRLAMTALSAGFSSSAAAAGSDLTQDTDNDMTSAGSSDVLAARVEVPTVPLGALTASRTDGELTTPAQASTGAPHVLSAAAHLVGEAKPTTLISPPSPLGVATMGVPSTSMVAQLPNVANDPNRVALDSVARDPSYAAAAAAFYTSAAGSLKLNGVDAGTVSDAFPLRTVLEIQTIRPLKPV